MKLILSNRKKIKDEITNSLITTMKQNEIDSVNINNGKIEYTQRKTKKPISKKLLQNLSNWFGMHWGGRGSVRQPLNHSKI